MIHIHFADFFGINPDLLELHGAFNVSLINDLPLFVDPFLLFNSDDEQYKALHDEIIRYLRFLRDKALAGEIAEGLLRAWFTFPEVRENWLGYSESGNAGSGLGMDFARSLHSNLNRVFTNFGDEEITRGSHLEKLCLVDQRVGRDNISDFVVNMIKEYLLRYSQDFALQHLPPESRKVVPVEKVRFNYGTETWESDHFELPWSAVDDDFVLLTPKNLLTKDDVWINRAGLHGHFDDIVNSVPNDQLRAQINNYLLRQLEKDPGPKEVAAARSATVKQFPVLIEYYIRLKEDHGDEAVAASNLDVRRTEALFVNELRRLAATLQTTTTFYDRPGTTYDEARERVVFLKDVIENKGGHELFWASGRPRFKEKDVHILFRLCWLGTPSDLSREANDGRGPADFKVSRGALDKTIVEFKLAANKRLKQNLARQTEIYQSASDAKAGLKVIVYFSEEEKSRVDWILMELGIAGSDKIVLIDARRDNKPSASKA